MGADMTHCCVPACDLTPPRIERIKQRLEAIQPRSPLARLVWITPEQETGYNPSPVTIPQQVDECQRRQRQQTIKGQL